ncbi:MAG: hypothetical protein GX062_06600 [Firmicutes bacterium]|nr:hypothetical protein [Bacillota bacterium]
MHEVCRRKVILLLIILELALAAFTVRQTASTTAASRRVGVGLDWNELQGVAQAAGVPVEEMAAVLKEQGAHYLVLREDTLARLEQTGRLQAYGGWELWQLGRLLKPGSEVVQRVLADKDFNVRSTYLVLGDADLYQRLKERLSLRYKGDVQAWSGDNTYVLAVARGWDALQGMGVGINPTATDSVYALGYEPVLAWLDRLKTSAEITLDLKEQDKTKPALLLPGPLPVEEQERVGRELGQRGILQGLLEFSLPSGAKTVAAASNYLAVRVYERPVHTMYQEYLLAVRDRNVRFVIPHLLWQVPDTAPDLLSANAQHLGRSVAAIRAGGFAVGAPVPLSQRLLNPVLLALLLGLPLLTLVQAGGLREADRVTFSLLALMTPLAAVYLLPEGPLIWLRQGAALIVGGVGPALAMILALRKVSPGDGQLHPLRGGVTALGQASGVTLAAALFIQALLGDASFLLKLDAFLGIKVAYSITLALVLLWSLKERSADRGWWLKPVFSPAELIALAGLGLVVWVLFNRSGNTSVIPIPAWELKLRDLLERVLLIRPRTKEFLLGHPALVLAGAGLGKGKWWRPYLVTLAAVGQASLLNTFVHLHTPFLISLARSLLGLLLGAAIGSLLTLAGYYLVRGGRRYA